MNTIPFQQLNIYSFSCDEALIDKVTADIKETNIFWKTIADYAPNVNGSSQYGYLNEENTAPYYHYELFSWIQECIDKVSELHYNNTKLSIVDSWLTKTNFGDRSAAHSHSNSVITGLLYFSTFKKSGTVFTYNDPWRDHLSFLHFENSTKDIVVYPEKGKLLLWRSDILHSIQPHSDIKNTRYTLAFNTFVDGSVGTIGTNKIEIKAITVKDQYEAFMNKNNK